MTFPPFVNDSPVLPEEAITWNHIGSEVEAWAVRNFGQSPPFQPLLGLFEEIGEFYQAGAEVLSTKRHEMLVDAIGDQCVYALNLCAKVGIDFGRDVANTQVQTVTVRELLGVIGALSHAELKNNQGIRGMTYDQRRFQMRVALNVWFRWACNMCSALDLPRPIACTLRVWEEVKLRDWKKNPDGPPTGPAVSP